ncbi:MAG TPA: O-antigen ligase family protein, partial [Alphaproteobacteria bacterium]
MMATAFLAALIQIQLSVGQEGGYLGLRVNLADVLLPVMGFAVLVLLATKKAAWPQWILRGTWWWLAALGAVMIFSFFNGHFITGEWSRWALVNKLAGWFILTAYFCLGGWIATNSGNATRALFADLFVTAFCAVAAASLAVLYFYDAVIFTPETLIPYPLRGLMGNRNAFAFLAGVVMIMAAIKDFRGGGLHHRFLLPLLAFLLPLAVFETGSRTGAAVVAIAFVTIFFLHPAQVFRRMMPWIALGIVTVFLIHSATGSPMLRENQVERTSLISDIAQKTVADERMEPRIEKRGEAVRLRTARDAIALWREYPFFGA